MSSIIIIIIILQYWELEVEQDFFRRLQRNLDRFRKNRKEYSNKLNYLLNGVGFIKIGSKIAVCEKIAWMLVKYNYAITSRSHVWRLKRVEKINHLMLNERQAHGIQKTPRMGLNHMIHGEVMPPGSQSRFLNLLNLWPFREAMFRSALW